MSKIGVGVGEEFPVDEEPHTSQSQEDVPDDERFCSHGARRKAWRKFRRQMHEDWHSCRRAFRDRMNRREDVEVMNDHRLHHLVLGGLALIGLAAIVGVLHHRD